MAGGSYDASGNMLGVPYYTFTYDAENRQVSETNTVGNPSASYGYDGNGQRVAKIVGSEETLYIYDAMGNLTAEYDQDAGTNTVCQTCYLTYDDLGSVGMVTDGAANVMAWHDFLPFGEEILGGMAGRSTSVGPGLDNVKQKFTGQERDTETGLDFFQARYFSGAMGRFTSPDPGNAGADLTNPETWNGYAYVGNNPLAYVDPSGMSLWSAIGDFFSGAWGGITDFFGGGGGGGATYCLSFGDDGCGASSGASSGDGGYSGGGGFGAGGGIQNPTPSGGGGGGGPTAQPSTPKPQAPKNAPNNFSKRYPLTTPCSSTATQAMGAVEGNFARFGNYSRWGGLESVTFSPPAGMGVGSTIPINVRIFGIHQAVSVTVQSMNAQSMTFTTNPGHLIYPGFITFAASPASPGSINFNINLGGTVTSPAKFNFGGSAFEDAQWNHFLGQVGGFCGAGH